MKRRSVGGGARGGGLLQADLRGHARRTRACTCSCSPLKAACLAALLLASACERVPACVRAWVVCVCARSCARACVWGLRACSLACSLASLLVSCSLLFAACMLLACALECTLAGVIARFLAGELGRLFASREFYLPFQVVASSALAPTPSTHVRRLQLKLIDRQLKIISLAQSSRP